MDLKCLILKKLLASKGKKKPLTYDEIVWDGEIASAIHQDRKDVIQVVASEEYKHEYLSDFFKACSDLLERRLITPTLRKTNVSPYGYHTEYKITEAGITYFNRSC